MMYYLVLVAFFQIDIRPHVVQWHRTADACFASAAKMNKQDDDLDTDEARTIGLRYVCVKLTPEV